MKKYSIIGITCMALFACNNRETRTDTDSPTDSITTMPADTTTTNTSSMTMPVDSATARFLVKATEGGLAEVAAGQMAQSKATDESVKMFAGMMVQDHTGVNAQVQTLAMQRQVSLPSETSEENKKKAADTDKKTGKAFDKAYMDMMVAAHKKTIDMFEKASGKTGDTEVKNFISQTLPKVKMHLDSAQAIRKRLP
jgi:putative membrane protein